MEEERPNAFAIMLLFSKQKDNMVVKNKREGGLDFSTRSDASTLLVAQYGQRSLFG